MCARRTKKKNEPDSAKSGTQNRAERDFGAPNKSTQSEQTIFPFDSPRIHEKNLIPWLCSVVYGEEYSAGGEKKSGALKRVRSRISYARDIKALAPASRDTVEAAPFFEWALKQKKWEELSNVQNLTKGVVALVKGTQAKASVAQSTLAFAVPDTREELLANYLTATSELRNAQLEIDRLADSNADLSAQLVTKAEKSRQASKHGKKGAGISREKKELG